jgi:hypothetical protein
MSATIASLTARADGGRFVLTQTANTPLVSGNAPLQGTHPLQGLVPHGSPHRTAISWNAVYRSQILRGDTLVVDSSVAASALELVLDHVNTVFDALDLRLNLVGVPPNATRASPIAVGEPNENPNRSPSGGT